MPTGQQYSSTAPQTNLVGGINNTQTNAITLSSFTGWPATPFTGVFDIGTATQEAIDVLTVSGNTITNCTRGIDGTSAQAHSNNATFTHADIGRDFREMRAHIDAASSNDSQGHVVHGLAVGSAVVGTTDTQTLTNKTLTSPTITGMNSANPNITGTVTGAAQYQNITAGTAAVGSIPLISKGLANQTADLFDVQTSGGTAVFSVAANGATGAGATTVAPTDTAHTPFTVNAPSGSTSHNQDWASNGVVQAFMTNSGIMNGPAYVASGLTGAAHSGRWAGNTTGGPPTTGTFVAGDIVFDQTYNIPWICTSGGTPGTWKPMGQGTIASTTVGVGGAASVTFSSIPSFFTNLEIKVSAISTVAANQDILQLQFNGDTGAHYEQGYIFIQNSNTVTGSHTGNNTSAACGFMWGNSSATVPGVSAIEIPGYSATTLIKGFTFHSHASDTSALSWLIGSGGGGWNSTAAITSITLVPLSGNFAQNSVITLYGLP